MSFEKIAVKVLQVLGASVSGFLIYNGIIDIFERKNPDILGEKPAIIFFSILAPLIMNIILIAISSFPLRARDGVSFRRYYSRKNYNFRKDLIFCLRKGCVFFATYFILTMLCFLVIKFFSAYNDYMSIFCSMYSLVKLFSTNHLFISCITNFILNCAIYILFVMIFRFALAMWWEHKYKTEN